MKLLHFLILCVAIILPLSVSAAVVQVRGFIWGVQKHDVRQYEQAVFWEEGDDFLRFFEDKENIRRVVEYDFRGGKLWRVHYDYRNLTPPNPDIVSDLYERQKSELTNLYGAPVAEKAVWRGRSGYRPYPELWGRALYSGNLRLVTEWQLLNTRIILQAYGEGQGFYKLFYTAEKHDAQEQRTQPILRLPGQD